MLSRDQNFSRSNIIGIHIRLFGLFWELNSTQVWQSVWLIIFCIWSKGLVLCQMEIVTTIYPDLNRPFFLQWFGEVLVLPKILNGFGRLSSWLKPSISMCGIQRLIHTKEKSIKVCRDITMLMFLKNL